MGKSEKKSRDKRTAKQVTPGLRGKPGVKFNPDYFVLPHPLAIVIIPVGLGLLVAATFAPESIPDFLGPLGAFAKFLGTEHNNICVAICAFAAAAHSGEAAVAGWICYERRFSTVATIKWVISTFCFGFTSLLLRLWPYQPYYKSA